MRGVYILHFSQPYCHARHYIGSSADIARRVREHRGGYGHPLTKAVVSAGGALILARVFPINDAHTRLAFEYRLKGNSHVNIICPVCNPVSADKYPTTRRRKRSGDCPF